MNLTQPTGRNQIAGAAFLALAMACVVGTVIGFQLIGHYMPCELCLKERIPYYAGVPLMLIAFILAMRNAPAQTTRGLLALGGIIMLVGAALSIYHAGVEWHFWPGPSSCTGSSGAISGSSGGGASLLDSLNTVKPPSCDVAAGRFLGLSFAGWNVVAAVVLAAIAFKAAFGRAR